MNRKRIGLDWRALVESRNPNIEKQQRISFAEKKIFLKKIGFFEKSVFCRFSDFLTVLDFFLYFWGVFMDFFGGLF